MCKVCHFTSVHTATDGRIFEKECVSLAKAGYEVYLVAPNAEEGIRDGVRIVNVPVKRKGRLYRMLFLSRAVFKKALSLDADIYHFHDPELLRFALRLKRKGKKVIFDSHEDVPNQILGKEWLPKSLRNLIANLYGQYEKWVLSKLDAVVSVTPAIVNRLIRSNPNTYQIANYPLLQQLEDNRMWNNSICFAGGISPQWMHENIIEALNRIENVTYNLAGKGMEKYLNNLKKLDGWSKVNYIGKIPFKDVPAFLQQSSIGIALIDYVANAGYKEGTIGNTKLFEYMMAGIPVIATDFNTWKHIIEKYDCGICVNPHDIKAIVDAINFLLTDKQLALQKGNNGKNAVLVEFNWLSQEKILYKMYDFVREKC